MLFRNYTEWRSGKRTWRSCARDNSTAPRRAWKRIDAQRNTDSLLEAAKTAFATSGVDAPAKEIAALAGALGVGTVYRNFPRRSDLVVAVLRREIDACAAAGPALSASPYEPAEALAQWLAA